MRCIKARKRLALFVGGDATYKEGESVKEHIIDCKDCAGEAESYEQSLRTLHLLKEHSLPEDFWDGYNAGILRRIRTEEARPRRRLHIDVEQVRTVLSAAAVLLLAVAFAWPFVFSIEKPTVVDANQVTPPAYKPIAPPARNADTSPGSPWQDWFQPIEIPAPREI
jgi:hypothetical protein